MLFDRCVIWWASKVQGDGSVEGREINLIWLQGWSRSIVQETRELIPGEAISPCPRGNALPAVLCLWEGGFVYENLPFHVNMSTDSAIALVSFMQPFLGDIVPPDFPVLWHLSAPSSVMFTEPQMQELGYRHSHWNWAPQNPVIFALRPVAVSVMISIWLQREASLMRSCT